MSSNHSIELLTREQAAKFLTISPRTLATWAANHRYDLPFVKIGRAVRYRRSDLLVWLDERTMKHNSEDHLDE